MKQDNGGPAFPHDKYQRNEHGDWGTYAHGGMSLRDWFAGQALAGMFGGIAIGFFEDQNQQEPSRRKQVIDYIAMIAGEAADAMIAERNKK